MAKRKFSTLLSTVLVVAGFASASPASADHHECIGSALDAVTSLPSPLRKWGQIACTQFGPALAGRDGWVWVSLKDAGEVAIVAGTPPHGPDDSSEPSYFTRIQVDELRPDELAFAMATFDQGLKFGSAIPKVYRVDLTVASGNVAKIVFFDFGAFAGGMFCPEDDCIADSRFLIMKRENKNETTAAIGQKHTTARV